MSITIMRKRARIPFAATIALFAVLLSTFYFTNFSSAAGCPCGLWSTSDAPAQVNVSDSQAVELGFKFTSSVSGNVTGIRFYKSAQNTGTHVGSLWNSSGTRLTSIIFTNETASGWQQASFPTPVPIQANTTYIASYNSPTGNYSATQNYFIADHASAPLVAPASSTSGGNGVYAYGAAGSYPNQSYNSTNYWIDVVFDDGSQPDTTAPTIQSVTPAANATNISLATNITAKFDEALNTATVNSSSVELRNASNQTVASTLSFDQSTNILTINPDTDLAPSTTYTVTIKGGATDPRVKDTAGNALAQNNTWSFTTASTYCGSLNEIACENTRPGTPASQWDIGETAGDPNIQGFTTDISTNRGSTVRFKVKTPSTNYQMDIYRLGYYNGDGARKVTTIIPSTALPQTQPDCLSDVSTGLVDCGNWAESATWNVPSDAVSGVYVARLKRLDATSVGSQIIFVVRNDASTSNILYQTSDTTWGAAYNDYGGNSLYSGSPAGRAYKVSYNRPLNTRSTQYKRTHFFANEQPMIRWMEANGYDISYSTGVDTDRQPSSVIKQHKMFMSSGHDEYWAGMQRTHVEEARDAGVNLSFFSGNEVFWKTRWENSIDGTGTSHRTLVTYKESTANAKIDPSSEWTGNWRDPRFSPPSDGGRPENALTGQIFTVNCCSAAAIKVPAEDGKLRIWRNTSVANLTAGQTATLTSGVIGFEYDEDLDNGFRPAGLIRMSSTLASGVNKLQGYGDSYATGDATHSITLYKAPSGALVFGAGTVRWSWGLDGTHDDSASAPTSAPDPAMKQATVNLFADMGVQPTTLQAGLVATTKSTDTTAPTSTITSPAAGATIQSGTPITITGTATDVGGRVGGIEVSVDGGATWHRAEGRANWSYTASFSSPGSVTIRARATDDSLNTETPGAGITATVTASSTISILSASGTPQVESTNDPAAVEVGMKFKSDVAGTINGVRFYKGTANTGAHTGSLWDINGNRLATVAFTGESASGWQQANFASPVAVLANTTYVISYYAPSGHYSSTSQQLLTTSIDNAPLHGLASSTSGGNGVYKYASGGGYPDQTFNGSNYWVDVAFTSGNGTPDTEAPTAPANLTASAPSAAQVSLSWTASSDNTGVTGYRIYQGGTQIGTSTSTSYTDTTVSASTSYAYTVRANDAAGNVSSLSNQATVTTPAASATTSVFGPSDTPAITINESNAVELGMKFRSDKAGKVTGVKFYKATTNIGTHIGTLWSSTGGLLATVIFTGETGSGWQRASFSAPVDIQANTTYVISYYAPNGNYSATGAYFATTSKDSAPLHGLASGIDGSNGVYKYGAASAFPDQSFNNTNYWVDVVFVPSA